MRYGVRLRLAGAGRVVMVFAVPLRMPGAQVQHFMGRRVPTRPVKGIEDRDAGQSEGNRPQRKAGWSGGEGGVQGQ